MDRSVSDQSRSKLFSTPVFKPDPVFSARQLCDFNWIKVKSVFPNICHFRVAVCIHKSVTVRLLPHPRVRLQLNRDEEPLLIRLLLHQTQTPHLELSPQCMRQDGFSCVRRCCFLDIFVLQENRSTERDHCSDPPFDAFLPTSRRLSTMGCVV